MEQFKVNAIAHLILDHISGIRDYFESAIGTTNDQEIEINMFHSIDDFASEVHSIIEIYKDVNDWQEYRKKLRVALSIDRRFHPIIYTGTDHEERIKTFKQNELIHTEIMRKLNCEPMRRWSQISSLRKELDLFNKYHPS